MTPNKRPIKTIPFHYAESTCDMTDKRMLMEIHAFMEYTLIQFERGVRQSKIANDMAEKLAELKKHVYPDHDKPLTPEQYKELQTAMKPWQEEIKNRK